MRLFSSGGINHQDSLCAVTPRAERKQGSTQQGQMQTKDGVEVEALERERMKKFRTFGAFLAGESPAIGGTCSGSPLPVKLDLNSIKVDLNVNIDSLNGSNCSST